MSMSSIGKYKAIGNALMVAGQGIEKNYLTKMEQMRQDSLERLERERLGIMRTEADANAAYRTGMLELQGKGAFEEAQQTWRTNMEKSMAGIINKLPSERAQAMFMQMMRGMDVEQLATLNVEDAEKLNEVLNTILGAQAGGETIDPREKDAIIRGMSDLARTGLKEWGYIQKRYPNASAPDYTIKDIFAMYPSLVNYADEAAAYGQEPAAAAAAGTPEQTQQQKDEALMRGFQNQAPPRFSLSLPQMGFGSLAQNNTNNTDYMTADALVRSYFGQADPQFMDAENGLTGLTAAQAKRELARKSGSPAEAVNTRNRMYTTLMDNWSTLRTKYPQLPTSYNRELLDRILMGNMQGPLTKRNPDSLMGN